MKPADFERLTTEPPGETAAERHTRYCEAARHGIDIGIDRSFVESLLRGERLNDDFLRVD